MTLMVSESATFADTVRIDGQLTLSGGIQGVTRANLSEDSNAAFHIPIEAWKVWNARQTNLPFPAATDDLEINTGTLGTSFPSLQTGDLKAAGSTDRYAGVTFMLPPEYIAASTVTLRFRAAMVTTIADTAASIDCEAYSNDFDLTVSADLVTTASQSINNLVFAWYDFTVTPSGLSPGSELDIRVKINVNDAGTGTAVIGCIAASRVLLDIKG